MLPGGLFNSKAVRQNTHPRMYNVTYMCLHGEKMLLLKYLKNKCIRGVCAVDDIEKISGILLNVVHWRVLVPAPGQKSVAQRHPYTEVAPMAQRPE